MEFHAAISAFSHFSEQEWAEFRIYLQRRRIGPPSPADDIVVTCDVCCDDTYWAANGGPIARWLACGPLGLGCPACP